MGQKNYARVQFDNAIPEEKNFKSKASYLQCLTDIAVDFTANVAIGWFEVPLTQTSIKCTNGFINHRVYHTPEDILVSLTYTQTANPEGEGLRVDWGSVELHSNINSVDSLVKMIEERMSRLSKRYLRE